MTRRRPTSSPALNGADPLEEWLLNVTRRKFFGTAAQSIGAGLGGLALAQLATSRAAAAPTLDASTILSQLPHHAPKAKRVIYMHMEGAPSQIDLYDYKPQLNDHYDKELPASVRMGQHNHRINQALPLAGSAPHRHKLLNQQATHLMPKPKCHRRSRCRRWSGRRCRPPAR